MDLPVVLSSKLSWPISKMGPGQQLSPTARTPATVVLHVLCSFPLLFLSMETFGVSSSHHVSVSFNCSSHTVYPNSERKLCLLSPSLLRFLSSFPLWASILASDLSCILGTHFPPPFLPRVAIFVSGWQISVSVSAVYYSTIFLEVSLPNSWDAFKPSFLLSWCKVIEFFLMLLFSSQAPRLCNISFLTKLQTFYKLSLSILPWFSF